jgi:hypothetical protein
MMPSFAKIEPLFFDHPDFSQPMWNDVYDAFNENRGCRYLKSLWKGHPTTDEFSDLLDYLADKEKRELGNKTVTPRGISKVRNSFRVQIKKSGEMVFDRTFKTRESAEKARRRWYEKT